MSAIRSIRPDPAEHAPFYLGYLQLVPEGEDVLLILERQLDDARELLAGLSEEQAAFRYAPEKWSIKEVVGHLTDSERVFAYRALRFARGDATPLAGYEQDDYVANGRFSDRSLPSLLDELRFQRLSNLALFASFDDETLLRRGEANGQEVTVRALMFITAGHLEHHLKILREKYL